MRDGLAISAPAKLNLSLHVTGRRDDGYHLLETLAVFTDYGDVVRVAPSDIDRFDISGPFADGLSADPANLVLRARDALRDAFPTIATGPVAIKLQKNLPVASGIGGGSSDAAATFRALVSAWHLTVDDDGLSEIALPLGADLPMCLAAKPLVARGAGEALEPLKEWPVLHLVLVNPNRAVATADVFHGLTRRDNPPLPPPPSRHNFAAICAWLRATRNDLQVPALAIAPDIGRALAALEAAGASFSRMSGSGATCFGLFATAEAAGNAASAISALHPAWFVTATRSMASED